MNRIYQFPYGAKWLPPCTPSQQANVLSIYIYIYLSKKALPLLSRSCSDFVTGGSWNQVWKILIWLRILVTHPDILNAVIGSVDGDAVACDFSFRVQGNNGLLSESQGHPLLPLFCMLPMPPASVATVALFVWRKHVGTQKKINAKLKIKSLLSMALPRSVAYKAYPSLYL